MTLYHSRKTTYDNFPFKSYGYYHMDKHWIGQALTFLKASLEPAPHELNELDWKVNLSDNKDRLTEHLIAFANHPNGGFLVYGIADAGANLVGVDQIQVE